MRNRLFAALQATILLLVFAACRQPPKHEVIRGFYYWKTNVALSAYEARRLQTAGCRRLYVRVFDVQAGPDGHPQPAAVACFREVPKGVEVVPVVFVVNDVLKGLGADKIQELANRMAGLIQRQCSDAGLQPREVQIDCDWTGSTRDVYFALLRGLKTAPFFQKKILSATIRLHQVRYAQQSGVPPADRGLLMCYNMGDTRKAGAHNSILDAGLAKRYLVGVKAYPLSLDLALPIFRWCLLFDGPQFKGIIREAAPETAAACPAFDQRNAYEYRCLRDTLWCGTALKKGMTVRAEEADLSAVKEVAAFLAQRLSAKPLSVVLYHADSLTLQPFSDDELEEIYRACE